MARALIDFDEQFQAEQLVRVEGGAWLDLYSCQMEEEKQSAHSGDRSTGFSPEDETIADQARWWGGPEDAEEQLDFDGVLWREECDGLDTDDVRPGGGQCLGDLLCGDEESHVLSVRLAGPVSGLRDVALVDVVPVAGAVDDEDSAVV